VYDVIGVPPLYGAVQSIITFHRSLIVVVGAVGMSGI
jgi:hypothetical protein